MITISSLSCCKKIPHFDERIQAAKEKLRRALLIGQIVKRGCKLIAIVNPSFKVSKQGQIDINKVLALFWFRY
ncbi:MAG: DUF3164 family protein [Arsenophonus sp. NC-PE1-MAG3]